MVRTTFSVFTANLDGVGGFERTPQLDAFCRQRNLTIAFASEHALRSIHDPANLARLAADAGIVFPETWQLADDGSALKRLVGAASHPASTASAYLLKPIQHAGGIGIRFASDTTKLPTGYWLQRYWPGTPIGASYIACPVDCKDDNQKKTRTYLVGVCQSLLDPHRSIEPFLYHGSVGPLSLPPHIDQVIERVGRLAAEQFGLVGLFNIDFIFSDSALVLLEVNPRYSASMELLCEPSVMLARDTTDARHEASLPWSLVDWHVRAFQNDFGLSDEVAACLHRESATRQPSCGNLQPIAAKRIVYAAAPCLFDLLTAQNVIQRVKHQYVAAHPWLEPKLADIPAHDPANRSVIDTGHPICTVLIHGAADAHSAMELADHAAKQLQASMKTV